METMETVNVLNQMAEYDFSTPINVTMIFEDSDDDISYENVLIEQPENITNNNNNQDASAQISQYNEDNKKRSKKNSEILNKIIHLNKKKNNEVNNPILKEMNKQIKDTIIVDSENSSIQSVSNSSINSEKNKTSENTKNVLRPNKQNKSKKKQKSLVKDKAQVETDNTNEVHIIEDQVYDDEPVATFIDDLLNTLSDHLILIMHSFYHYGVKRNTCEQDKFKSEKVFHFIKSHFFELSYSTVESIILPQEKNETFIKQFLENTVLIANNKSMSWKCQRRHVEPFFNDLVVWTKQKRSRIKTLNLQLSSNENVLLKQCLNTPPQLHNLSYSKSVTNSDQIPNQTVQDNVCIFSSGAPGNEIRLDVSKDALVNWAPESQKQYNNNAECTRSQNNYSSNVQSAPRNLLIAPPPYGYQYSNHHRLSNIKYYRHPPPYRMPQNYIHNYSSQNNHNIVQPTQNCTNIRQALRNHQNMGPPIQNYGTQAQYPNNNPIPFENSYMNYLHNNNQMHGTQIGHENTRPIITNITSVNSMASMGKSGRCCMCSKNIETPPPVPTLNLPRELPYCSYLCQELASQVHKITGDYT